MIFMRKNQTPIVLPEPKIIYVNATHRVIERPCVTLSSSTDDRPLAFCLELFVERNTPDALKSPAWHYMGTEASLCDYAAWAPGARDAWRAFFSVIRSIPRSTGG